MYPSPCRFVTQSCGLLWAGLLLGEPARTEKEFGAQVILVEQEGRIVATVDRSGVPLAGEGPGTQADGIVNGDFSDGLTGWDVGEAGGTNAPGGVGVVSEEAELLEGDSFLVTLSQSFTMPAGVGKLWLPRLQGLPDRREDLRRCHAGSRDHATQHVAAVELHHLTRLRRGVLFLRRPLDGEWAQVDVMAVPAGTAVTLYCDLIGADGDENGGATFFSVTQQQAGSRICIYRVGHGRPHGAALRGGDSGRRPGLLGDLAVPAVGHRSIPSPVSSDSVLEGGLDVIMGGLSAIVILGWGLTGWAGTLYVDVTNPGCPGSGTEQDPYCSIQTAIAAAQHDDVILVAPGTYLEAIDYLGKSLTVRSTGGRSVTTIDAGGAFTPVVTFANGEQGAVLEGFTLRGGKGYWPDIFQPRIGGGVLCLNGSSPIVLGNHITDNEADEGGGIWAENATPTIRNNTIAGNDAIHGAGIGLRNSDAQIESNLLLSNVAYEVNSHISSGGGISIRGGEPHISRNEIRGNVATANGGFGGVGYSTGGGIASSSAARIENNLIVDNTASSDMDRGGGFFGSAGLLLNNTIVGNQVRTAYYGRGSGVYGESGLRVMNTIVWGNDPAPDVQGSVQVEYSLVEGGYPGSGNISGNPQFVERSNGDYRLACDSPCRDAGTASLPAPYALPAVDFEGEGRANDGDGSGTAEPDIGADEHHPMWRLVGQPVAGGAPVRFAASGPTGTSVLLAEVLISRSRGELPLPGPWQLGLAPDALFSLWLAAPVALRRVTSIGCPETAAAPFQIPLQLQGWRIFYAGVAVSPGGQIVDVTPSLSFLIL